LYIQDFEIARKIVQWFRSTSRTTGLGKTGRCEDITNAGPKDIHNLHVIRGWRDQSVQGADAKLKMLLLLLFARIA
jgi:hypothetical protein